MQDLRNKLVGLHFYRTQVYLGSDLWVQVSETDSLYLVETYTSYASYTSYTSYTSGAIWWPNLQPMQVAPSGGQMCN